MIIEQRTYTLHPGKVPAYLEIYQREAYGIQTKVLGNLVGWFTADTGTLNQVIHMWAYANYEERSRRRDELYKSEEWLAVLPKLLQLIVTMDTKILVPTPFAPIRRETILQT